MAKLEHPAVFVVEDDDGMRQAVERLLRGAGYRPSGFVSAEALLAAGCAAAADCLVLDVRLPGLSGLELAAELDRRGDRPPVVFITAHDEPRASADAERLGALAYLIKPFPRKLFLEAVARAVATTHDDPNRTDPD